MIILTIGNIKAVITNNHTEANNQDNSKPKSIKYK